MEPAEITVTLNYDDIETIRAAMHNMMDQARCGGGFDKKDWADCKQVLEKVDFP